MSKKTTETKPEKQAVKKQPIDLSDEQLESAQGGYQTPAESSFAAGASGDVAAEKKYFTIIMKQARIVDA